MRAAVLALCAAVALADSTTVINTPLGPVKGIQTPLSREFRGVPYAKPPINALRWQSPVPIPAWGPSTIDATADAPSCLQDCQLPSYACAPAMSEDCLYLNVFTPLVSALTTPVPVLLFMHGGNFKQGYAGGLLYNSTVFANYTSTIVVVIQYRLGALGYLYGGKDSAISGNYGFFDQRVALKWVQANIAAFGGDPARVTVFGQSAGSMSIATHLASPGSKGLFQYAILESEPFGLPFRDINSWDGIVADYVKYAGCNGTADIDTCLKAASANTLLRAQVMAEKDILADATRLLDLFIPWTPTVGSVDVPAQPMDSWIAGNMQDIPMIVGTVADEGWLFVFEAFGKPLSYLEYEALILVAFGHNTQINAQYPQNYTGDNRPVGSHVARDSLFHCATRNVTLEGPIARNSPAFVYRFDHPMSFADVAWGANFSYCDPKTCHGGELAFVYRDQDPAIGVVFTADEVVMSNAMMTYWSNMAKSGNPNMPVTPAVAWPAFNLNTETMLLIETPQIQTVDHLDTPKCEMWNSVGYNFP